MKMHYLIVCIMAVGSLLMFPEVSLAHGGGGDHGGGGSHGFGGGGGGHGFGGGNLNAHGFGASAAGFSGRGFSPRSSGIREQDTTAIVAYLKTLH